jgi:putative DNA primase/helicase
MTLDGLLEKLTGVRRVGDGYEARCPAHDDQHPSLTIANGTRGIVLRCHAGCAASAVVMALGLTMKDLFDGEGAPREIAAYDYRDEHETVLFQVVRYADKRFAQRRPGGAGWIWNLRGVRRVLYRLPELLGAGPTERVYLVEGEKDADALARLGPVATTNPGGAGKWRGEFSEALRGRHVVVLPDNDDPGREHARTVQKALAGVAATVHVLTLPGLSEHGDVSDWLAARHTVDELRALVAEVEASPRSENPTPDSPTIFVPLQSFLAEPETSVDWIVGGLLPAGGLAVLAAKPKVGKSTLARYIAYCVARGIPCLGHNTSQGLVLYVSIEERRRDVRAHFSHLASGAADLPLHVHVGPVPGTPPRATREAIREHRIQWLTREIVHHKPVLVIIDTWGRFLNVKDGNDYAEATEASEPLIELARSSGTHLLFTHHAKKGEAELIDSLLGSTAIAGSVDTVLLIRRHPDKTRTIASNQRVGDDLDDSVLSFDKAPGTLDLGGTLRDVQLAAAVQKVCAVLGAGPLTEQSIRERAGMRGGDAGQAIRSALAEKQIVRSGTGKRNDPYLYSVPKPKTRDEKEKGDIPPYGDRGDNRDNRDENDTGDARDSRPQNHAGDARPACPQKTEPVDPPPPDSGAEPCWRCGEIAGPGRDADGLGWCAHCVRPVVAGT